MQKEAFSATCVWAVLLLQLPWAPATLGYGTYIVRLMVSSGADHHQVPWVCVLRHCKCRDAGDAALAGRNVGMPSIGSGF